MSALFYFLTLITGIIIGILICMTNPVRFMRFVALFKTKKANQKK